MYQYYPNYTSYMPTTQPQMQSTLMPSQQFQQSQDLKNQMQIPQEHYGFISVKEEQQARNWPIAPGNSLTFKDESAPYIYTKTMGLSQFDAPVFEKYRLTKEEDPKEVQVQIDDNLKETIDNLKAELNHVQEVCDSLRKDFEDMRDWMQQPFANKNKKEKSEG